MLNLIWLLLLTAGLGAAAASGRWAAVTEAALHAGRSGVELGLGLVGVMAVWLGLGRLMEASGLLHRLVRLVRPLTRRIFPDVPAHDPAHGAIALNLLANLFGLGNAATPFGVQAMRRLAELDGWSGEATPAMCTLLALNTAAVTLVPTGVVAIRTAAGSENPGEIIGPTVAATLLAQAVALAVDRFLRWQAAGRRRRR
ncbi:MAG: nucleoside recognition domain-containing protein [Bacillota bacterium]|nr:nucleoside recognition domain-containing protein [Bacillota bacterium]